MMIEGGCLCGHVRYRSDGEPFHQTVCHCSDCRRSSGGATVAWFSVSASGFQYTADAPREHASSPGVMRTFCGACGTSLTYRHTDFPDQLDISIVSADSADQIWPKDHVHVSNRLTWDIIGDGRPQFSHGRADVRPQEQ